MAEQYGWMTDEVRRHYWWFVARCPITPRSHLLALARRAADGWKE